MDKPPSLILIARHPNGFWYRVGGGWRTGIGREQKIEIVYDDVRLPHRAGLALVTKAAFELLMEKQDNERRRRRWRRRWYPSPQNE